MSLCSFTPLRRALTIRGILLENRHFYSRFFLGIVQQLTVFISTLAANYTVQTLLYLYIAEILQNEFSALFQCSNWVVKLWNMPWELIN